MDSWHWLGAAVQGLLLGVLVLLRFDTLREKAGWALHKATRSAAKVAVIIPVGVIAVLLVPLWLGLIFIALTAVTVGVMSLAS